jgi:ABC-type multidrug transport system ATPase subunit
MSPSAVSIHDLRKSYDASFVLCPISFEIPRGASYGVLLVSINQPIPMRRA